MEGFILFKFFKLVQTDNVKSYAECFELRMETRILTCLTLILIAYWQWLREINEGRKNIPTGPPLTLYYRQRRLSHM